jgi:hypothetical protein
LDRGIWPKCILKHHHLSNSQKPKERLFSKNKNDFREWKWKPYDISWISKPEIGIEIGREICVKGSFAEFDVTNIISQVLNSSSNARQLTLSFSSSDHTVYIASSQQEQIEYFPVLNLYRKKIILKILQLNF